MISFKFLTAIKQSVVPFIHIPTETQNIVYDRRLSFCEYPITFSVYYGRFFFSWEPRDTIDDRYYISSWTGQIKDFKSYYEDTRVSFRDSLGEDRLPSYPTIRRIYVGTHYMINYQNEPRFMNPRFLHNHELVTIEYKIYEH